MKKFLKVCLVTALVMFLVGGVFSIAGRAAGGRRQFEDLVWNDGFSFPGNWGWQGYNDSYNYTGYSDDDWEEADLNFNMSQMIHKSDFDADLNRELDMNSVTALDLEVGGSVLNIEPSDDGEFHLTAVNVKKVQYYVENGKLYIRAEDRHNNWSKHDYTELYLYIPEGIKFTTAYLGLGAGEIIVEKLNADEVNMDVGAGSLQLERLTAQNAVLNLGMGETIISEAKLNNLNYEIGMGNLSVNGDITGDMTGNCSMGSVAMELSGKESDHNYEIEASMGTVTLDGGTYSGLSTERIINNGADSNFNITCSMGSIDIYFTNSL